jgi:hypothetical protein
MTPECPLCGLPPALILAGGHQAFCGNERCRVLTWSTHRPVDELLTQYHTVDLVDEPDPDDDWDAEDTEHD